MELLLGCGVDRDKKIVPGPRPDGWTRLVTADINPRCRPDVVLDADSTSLPFQADTFDEVHAYEVLEHLGQQGDYRAFFFQFGEIYRVLKPGGFLCATTPAWDHPWAWGDPGHRRIIAPRTLSFLDQTRYHADDPIRTDYRWIWRGDFQVAWMTQEAGCQMWMLRAVKPARVGAQPEPGLGVTHTAQRMSA